MIAPLRRSSLIVLTFGCCLTLPTSLPALDFVHDVMPILKKHCGKCHTGKRKEGGLAINSRAQLLAGGENGRAVVPGDAAKSALIRRIITQDDDLRMPPEGSRVPGDQVAVLRKWIDAGLEWEAGVSLGKSAWEPPLMPRVVELPPAYNGRSHPIDRLLDHDLATTDLPENVSEKNGDAKNKAANNERKIPPPISDAAFYRRVSLDAVGLLPEPEKFDEFVDESSGSKREQLIDRLLADDIAYADHWLTMWNDLLRNDYTGTGFITKGRTQITTWLYAALRDNMPYDQMVRELIAPTPASSGFIDGIKWRGDVNASQTREIQFAQNVSQVFLGINMKCASCHDSFIDRWTLSEAYNLAAIYADGPLELNRCDKPTGKMAVPQWIFPEIGDVDPNAPKAERLKQLAQLMTHRQNGRFTRTLVNRVWHRLMGRGIVHPVDAMHTEPWNEDLLDHLAVQFASDGYDLRKLIRFIMTSQAYQSRTVTLAAEPGDNYVYSGPLAKRMSAEQLLDSIWQITKTNPTSPTAKVDRSERPAESQSPASQSPASQSQPLPISAKWIWHDGQGSKKCELRTSFTLRAVPASATVLATCDNAFVMKVNGVQVASSRDWQQPVQFDIASRLIAGENRIEVAGEMFGGAAGFICQIVLRDKDGQRPIVTDKRWEVRKPNGDWQAAMELHAHGGGPWGAVLSTRPVSPGSAGRAPVRAALMQNDFLMRSLGRPHRDQVVTTRPGELTTLQAIDLSNGDILAGYLRAGARQLIGRSKSSGELIDWLYRFALSRDPSAGERAVLLEVAGDGRDPIAVEDVLWMIFMQPEFQIVR